MGHELSSDNKDFPDWFEFDYEKLSCLIGYNDADLNVLKTKEEIIEIIKNGI